jgi:phosphoserine phosphatase RsbU/P
MPSRASVWESRRSSRTTSRQRIPTCVAASASSPGARWQGLTPFLALQVAAGPHDVFSTFPFWVWAPAVLMLFLLPISLAYAVVRYRVIEMPLLLKRSARYLLVQRGFVVLVTAAGLAATLVLARVFPRVAPDRPDLVVPAGLVVGVLFGVSLAWAATRVHRTVTPWIDRAFFRNAYDARRILEGLAAHAADATSRDSLAEELERCLARRSHPERLVVYLAGRDGTLGAFRGAPPPGWLPCRPCRAGRPAALRPTRFSSRRARTSSIRFRHWRRLARSARLPSPGRGGSLLGLLVLGRRRSDEPYSGEDRRLLSAVCVQAGMALDSIAQAERMAERLEAERRAERELAIAQEVQVRLLPQAAPPLPTLEVRGICLQARAVGGDYYDFLDLGEDHLAIVLADISGKGISAALLMANLQAHLRAQCFVAGDDVGRLLTKIDQVHVRGDGAQPLRDRLLRPLRCSQPAAHLRQLRPHAAAAAARRRRRRMARTDRPGRRPVPDLELRRRKRPARSRATRSSSTPTGSPRRWPTMTRFLARRGCCGSSRISAARPMDDIVTAIVHEVQRFSGSVQEDDLTLVVARAR